VAYTGTSMPPGATDGGRSGSDSLAAAGAKAGRSVTKRHGRPAPVALVAPALRPARLPARPARGPSAMGAAHRTPAPVSVQPPPQQASGPRCATGLVAQRPSARRQSCCRQHRQRSDVQPQHRDGEGGQQEPAAARSGNHGHAVDARLVFAITMAHEARHLQRRLARRPVIVVSR